MLELAKSWLIIVKKSNKVLQKAYKIQYFNQIYIKPTQSYYFCNISSA